MRCWKAALTLGCLLVTGTGMVQAEPPFQDERWKPGTGRIKGFLVDPAGHGIPGIVTLSTPDGCRISDWDSNPDKRGLFEIRNVKPGRYLLISPVVHRVASDLIPPAPVEIEVRAGKTTRPTLVARCNDAR